MLTITRHQFDALAEQRRRRFERRLFSSLQQAIGNRTDRETLEVRVRQALAQSLRLFSTERDVARCVALVLRHFEAWPAGGLPPAGLKLLTGEALPAQRRLDNFERWARQRELHDGE